MLLMSRLRKNVDWFNIHLKTTFLDSDYLIIINHEISMMRQNRILHLELGSVAQGNSHNFQNSY